MNLKMAERMFSPGDYVTVKQNLDKTNYAFSATEEMLNLRGETIKVIRVGQGSGRKPPYVSAAGYSWHPSDLEQDMDNTKLITDMGQKGIYKFDEKSL